MKPVFMLLTVMGMLLGWSAQDDALLHFSTPGPDKYADGTVVLDGECYALVWTATGAKFAGIKADGTTVAETDKLILVAPVAKGGRCPDLLFQISSATAKALEGKGAYGVYLLDTRVKNAGGGVRLAGIAGGTPTAVNGFAALTEDAEPGTTGGLKTAVLDASAIAGATVTKETIVDVPTIKSIKVNGATVTVKVDGMSPIATYKVVTGDRPGAVARELDAQANGDTFEFPKPEGCFFKVIGTRNFK